MKILFQNNRLHTNSIKTLLWWWTVCVPGLNTRDIAVSDSLFVAIAWRLIGVSTHLCGLENRAETRYCILWYTQVPVFQIFKVDL